VNRRTFLLGTGAALVLAACGDDDDDSTIPSITTTPGPGAGANDDILMRTGAALSLTAANLNGAQAAAHRAHAQLLDPTVTDTHPKADAAWKTAADAELALAASCQAWAAALSSARLRQRVMSVGAATAGFYAVALSDPPSLPEAFQLTDPAVPDDWLLT